MKILFANSMKGLGGGERWLLDTASGLRARGHTVWVAARAGSPLASAARLAGAGVLEASFAHDLDPATVGALRGFYARERPGVVVAQIQRAHRLCTLASVFGPRVPVVLRVGQLRAVRDKWINRALWGRLAMVLANCYAVERALQATGLVRRGGLRVLYSGVGSPALTPRAEARRALGILPEEELVVCVARLAWRKGHDTLLEAWPGVLAARPGARLLLAGGGSEEPRLRQAVKLRGLEGSVRFTGELADVRTVWASADLSVLPSEEEGLPYAVLESMVARVPAVATRVAGIPEMLRHEETGLLVPPREPAALARELVRGLADRALACRLRDNAARLAAERFNYPRMLDRAETWLEEVCHDPGQDGSADA